MQIRTVDSPVRTRLVAPANQPRGCNAFGHHSLKSKVYGLWSVVFLVTCYFSFAAPDPSIYRDFSRYQVIIARQPFGEPPPPPDPVVLPPPGPPPEVIAWFKNIKVVHISTEGSKVSRVGFIDVPAKKNYLMKIGETEDDITVVTADYASESVTLRKNGVDQTISMKGEVSTPAAPGAPGVPGVMTASGRPGGPGAVALQPSGSRSPGERPMSYIERRRRMQEAADERLRRAAEAQSKIPPEEMEKHLQTYNMDLIRAKGEQGPPLPIPLTEDNDNQLVAEGVLPPRTAEPVPVPAPATE